MNLGEIQRLQGILDEVTAVYGAAAAAPPLPALQPLPAGTSAAPMDPA